MTTTLNSPPIVDSVPAEGRLFSQDIFSDDLSTCETLLAAAAGRYHYLTYLKITSCVTQSIKLGEGETSNDCTTTWIGPIPFSAQGGVSYELDLRKMGKAIKGSVNTAITAHSSTSGVLHIHIQGKTSLE